MTEWIEARNTCHICGSPIRVKFAVIKGISAKSILNDLQLCNEAECNKCNSISAWRQYKPLTVGNEGGAEK